MVAELGRVSFFAVTHELAKVWRLPLPWLHPVLRVLPAVVSWALRRPQGARVKGRVLGLKETKVKTALITVEPQNEPEVSEGPFKNWLKLDGQTSDENGVFTTDKLPPGA